MITNPNDTLDQALGLLGYRDELPSHALSNLLHAIQQYAGLSGNAGLEYACEARLNLIRSELPQKIDDSPPPHPTENKAASPRLESAGKDDLSKNGG